ncbi:shikimate dehydrogenase [Chitinimonas lacunae]|uniref:Shikimate dehydrogenase (NADP(+)) n=1 Tax=Chitinimonas lacunae TaxID=1963018 RepID=A0ABV8MRX3_9NEIS
MPDRYLVVGHPVAHSKSPFIHAAFARQTGQSLSYDRLDLAPDDFESGLADFFALGGAGCNITVPYKERAAGFANRLTERAAFAGAVNTLWLGDEGLVGDNTDGVGLVRDLKRHLALRDRRVLLLGAGGAARGVLAPLLAEQPAQLVIANRSADKAAALAELAAGLGRVESCAYEALDGDFDLVINATSASLAGETLPLPEALFSQGGLAYDMMYGQAPTAFLRQAEQLGAAVRLDGLGMLVEQAAEAFRLWRGVQPDTAPVLLALRDSLG